MAQWLTLSRAAHLIGVPRAVLQKMIAAGSLASCEGRVTSEELARLFPEVRLEDSGAFERITQIREEAFGKRVRERILPNQEVLAQRLAAQSEDLEEARRHLARYHDLIEALRERIDLLAQQAPAAGQLADLGRFIDAGLASVLGSEKTPDPVAVMDGVLRIMTAHVTVKPSGHEFFVEGSETLLQAALRAGLAPSYGCDNGHCGLCKARVVAGQVRPVRSSDYPLSAGERAQGHVLLCAHTAVSDLEVEMLEAAVPADIPEQELVVRVKRIAPLSTDIRLLHLQTPRASRLRFLAGQGVTLSVTGSTGNFRGDYPIASCPCDDRNLLFHIRRDADDAFAQRLFAGALKVNDPVSLFGPCGDFVLEKDAARDRLFVVCDTGFAPVKSLIEHAIAADLPGVSRLIWAATRPDGHYLENQCRAWADALETFSYATLTAADPRAAAAAAARCVCAAGDSAARDIYVAGPADFVAALTTALAAAGQPADRLHREALR